MVDEGYAATQILSQLHESIIENDLNDKQKSAITEKMAVSNSGGTPQAVSWVTNWLIKTQERFFVIFAKNEMLV